MFLARRPDDYGRPYVGNKPEIISGVSAVPSLHVAALCCYSLFDFAVSRRLVFPCLLFQAKIVASSV